MPRRIRFFTSGPKPSVRVLRYSSSRLPQPSARQPYFTPSNRARLEEASAQARM